MDKGRDKRHKGKRSIGGMRLKEKLELLKTVPKKKCRYCLSTENLTIDHKNPLSRGGLNERKNLQCLCKRCNGIKSNLSHGEVQRLFKWFREIEASREQKGGKKIFNRGK